MARVDCGGPAWSAEPVTVEDLADARALVRAAGLPTESLEDQFPGAYSGVRREGRLIAVAGLEVHGRHGLLRSVVVSPGRRGLGLGDVLVCDRLAHARRHGLQSVHLLTTTVPAFFERHGFRRVRREAAPTEIRASREFSQVCPDSAVALALHLDGDSAPA